MSILNPEHLFAQSERLIQQRSSGPPRQVDTRRAISAAYYGIFHATAIAAADLFVGRALRGLPRYNLVYRGINHRDLSDLCKTVMATTLKAKYLQYCPPGGFGDDMKGFAAAVVELQEKRHSADYDPAGRVVTRDAQYALSMARRAAHQFDATAPGEREIFLTLLLFPPR